MRKTLRVFIFKNIIFKTILRLIISQNVNNRKTSGLFLQPNKKRKQKTHSHNLGLLVLFSFQDTNINFNGWCQMFYFNLTFRNYF